MKDLNMKINGVYVREESVRSIEKVEDGYVVDCITRGLIKCKKPKDIAEVEKYMRFSELRNNFLRKKSNKVLTNVV